MHRQKIVYHQPVAKKETGLTLPFNLVVRDKDGPLKGSELKKILRENPDGLSLCLRYESGPKNRGGYFFHIKPYTKNNYLYSIFDFKKGCLTKLKLEALVSFINHCTGRCFHQGSFDLCASELNFISDD